ncbi:hypothetical protein XENORESO_019857 [Xenotaenia resolanae]|uniref:Uncharacterized protein n=1 Tax=Xenotaenia resolanae TaxID=208358 RepID=A0ABV0WH54_9TELE
MGGRTNGLLVDHGTFTCSRNVPLCCLRKPCICYIAESTPPHSSLLTFFHLQGVCISTTVPKTFHPRMSCIYYCAAPHLPTPLLNRSFLHVSSISRWLTTQQAPVECSEYMILIHEGLSRNLPVDTNLT